MNITFPEGVIVENVIPRNVIINRGAAEVDNHISRDDIFRLSPSQGMKYLFYYTEQYIRSFICCRFLSYAYHGEGKIISAQPLFIYA